MKRHSHGRTRTILLGLTLALSLGSLGFGVALGGSSTPTKGLVPPEADLGGGETNWSLVPDYIVALGRDGNPVGYASKEQVFSLVPDAFGKDGRPLDQPIPVYADDLATVVGHMVSGRGFVPLGTDIEAVPLFEASLQPVLEGSEPQ